MVSLTVLDTFAGIGGFSLGLEKTGYFETVMFCEIDRFCRRVLAQHWPGVPCHDDITTLQLPKGFADVITGGFPCQDVSKAGKRAGVTGKRSGLYRQLMRTLRMVRPAHAIVENVAELLNFGMGTVLGDLATSQFDAEWDCVPAAICGAPHRRDRVIIIAHADRERFEKARKLRPGKKHLPSGPDQNQGPAGSAADANRIGCGAGPAGEHEPRGQLPDGHGFGADQGEGRRLIEPGPSGRSHEFDASHAAGRRPQGHEHERAQGEQRAQSAHHAEEGGPGHGADTQGQRWGQGWTWRPFDSFARIREQARRHLADPYGSRFSFRQGIGGDAWEKLTPAERNAFGYGRKSIWPDEPALSRVDDGIPDWMDRTKATGNAVIPEIPRLIGLGIIDLEKAGGW